VTHVELTGDVRRGNNDGVMFLGVVDGGSEEFLLAPVGIDASFKFGRRISLGEFFSHSI
jgi:predicted methyltransferase MtxX (methanogen marker protein 4)